MFIFIVPRYYGGGYSYGYFPIFPIVFGIIALLGLFLCITYSYRHSRRYGPQSQTPNYTNQQNSMNQPNYANPPNQNPMSRLRNYFNF